MLWWLFDEEEQYNNLNKREEPNLKKVKSIHKQLSLEEKSYNPNALDFSTTLFLNNLNLAVLSLWCCKWLDWQ